METNANFSISRNGTVTPLEIEDLRESIGWDRCEGTYEEILSRIHCHYTARVGDELVGYLSIISDGVAYSFIIDLMVKPDFQRQGIATKMVRRAAKDIRDEGIRCIQVVFDPSLEEFYSRCGFHIVKAGIIDFKHMDVKLTHKV